MTKLFGHELLGSAKYEKLAINKLPCGRCGKTFSKEFGRSQNVLRKWAEQGTHPVVATNGLWRSNHDYSGESILTEGLKELEKFIRIAQDNPTQQFQYAIYTEHLLKKAYLKKVFAKQWELVKTIPNIILVNTPMSGGDILTPSDIAFPIKHFKNEIHGTWNPQISGAYDWACDGLHAVDADIQQLKNRHKAAKVIWLWMAQYNCRMSVADTTPIPKRKVRPVMKQIKSVDYLCENKGNVRLRKDSLWKSHADQHGNIPLGREQKPVLLTTLDKSSLDILNSSGIRIAKIPRKGTYEDGRPIYRLNRWGFGLQNKAVKTSGSPIVEIAHTAKGGKKISLGKVNPAFRENDWRMVSMPLSSETILNAETPEDEDFETLADIDQPIDPDWV